MVIRALVTRVLVSALAVLLPVGAAAQPLCRLALLLALDVSSSVDAEEYLLQKDGLAAALVSEPVMGALLNGDGPVALAAYEWSGRRQNVMVLDWVVLEDRDAVLAAADQIRSAPRSYSRFPTALGYALGFGATQMRKAPACLRRVIDVSGDGITNDGFWPALAYKHFPFDDITVNGLAVLGADPDVLDHYEFELKRGPGAFVETSQGYAGFRRAMERKLFREVNDLQVGGLQVQGAPG